MEERSGVTFPEPFRSKLKENHQSKAEGIEKGKWHCFDLPFMLLLGGEELFEEAKEVLVPLSGEFKERLAISYDRALKCDNLPKLKYRDGKYYVYCSCCSAKGGHYTAKDDAIKAWNTRHTADMVRIEDEKVRELILNAKDCPNCDNSGYTVVQSVIDMTISHISRNLILKNGLSGN